MPHLDQSAGRDYTPRWFDPSNGTHPDGSVAGAPGASVVMSHPGNDASNAHDWSFTCQARKRL